MPLDAPAVARKLKLAKAERPLVLGDPGGYSAALTTETGRAIADEPSGRHDWILLFAADRASLERLLPVADAALADPGTLWAAYPKGTSKRQGDLTRDAGWDLVRDTNLMWLSLVSIDETWSAFGMRHYKPGEARQAFR